MQMFYCWIRDVLSVLQKNSDSEVQRIAIDGKRSIEMRYYILDQNISAEEMSHIVRGHWEIENNLHWVLDVHFREDACKVKVKKAMQNLSLNCILP